MNIRVWGFLMLLLMAASAGAAQLYRWVDSKGNVEWRDTPPPASVPQKNIQQRRIGDNVISTSEAPYSLQLAMKNYPVTFWAATDCGNPCAAAREHLNRRGTPYTEKNVQEDIAAFQKLSGGLEVPYLQVGTFRVKGYLDSDYDNALDSAGYPRTAIAIRQKPAAPAPKPAVDGAKPPDAAATPASAGTAPATR